MGILPSSDSDVTAALAAVKARNEALRPSSTKSNVPLGLLNRANGMKDGASPKKRKGSEVQHMKLLNTTKTYTTQGKSSPSQDVMKSLYPSKASPSSSVHHEPKERIKHTDHRDEVDSSSDESDVEVDPATLNSLSCYLKNLNQKQTTVQPTKSTESTSVISIISSEGDGTDIDPATLDSVSKYIDNMKGKSALRTSDKLTNGSTSSRSRSNSPRKVNFDLKAKSNDSYTTDDDDDVSLSNDVKADVGAFIDALNKKPQVNEIDSSSIHTGCRSEDSITVGPQTEEHIRSYLSSIDPEKVSSNAMKQEQEDPDDDILLLERVSKSVSTESGGSNRIATEREEEAMKAYERHAQLLNSKLRNTTSGDSRLTALSSTTLQSPQLSPTMGRSIDSSYGSPLHSRSPSRSPTRSPTRSYHSPPRSPTRVSEEDVDYMRDDLSPTNSGFFRIGDITFDDMPENAFSNELVMLNYYISKAAQLSNKENLTIEDVNMVTEKAILDGIDREMVDEIFEGLVEKPVEEEDLDGSSGKVSTDVVATDEDEAMLVERAQALGCMKNPSMKELGYILIDARKKKVPIIPIVDAFEETYNDIYGHARAPSPTKSMESNGKRANEYKEQEFVDLKVMRLIYYVRATIYEEDEKVVTSLVNKAKEEGMDINLLRRIISDDQDAQNTESLEAKNADLHAYLERATALGKQEGSSEEEIRALLREAEKKGLPLSEIKETFIIEKKRVIKALSDELASRTMSGDEPGLELSESKSNDSMVRQDMDKYNQMELFDQTGDLEAFLTKFHDLKIGGNLQHGSITGLAGIIDRGETEKGEEHTPKKYSDFLETLPDKNDSALVETAKQHDMTSSQPGRESRDSSPGRRMFPRGYGLSNDSEQKEVGKSDDSGQHFFEDKFIKPGIHIDPRDEPAFLGSNSSDFDMMRSDSTSVRLRQINGVDAAIAMQKRRENRALQRSPYKRTKQVWELSFKERINGHPGFKSIDTKSVYLTTHSARKHHLDKGKWEKKEVKQNFLERKSFPNWFGVILLKKQSRKVHFPISHPKSVPMQISNPPDPNTWEEEWYTTWKTRKDNPNSLKRREMENNDDDDYQSVVTKQRRPNSKSSRRQITDLESCIGAITLSLPEIGTINTLRYRTGERVSRVHCEYTSFLRKSRWKKKYFPKGIFSN